MKLRRFNASGVQEFLHYLDRARQGEAVQFADLLDRPGLAEILPEDLNVEPREFANRREAAEYFHELLRPVQAACDVERDGGLWSWLGCAWIDILAPVQDAGQRTVREDARWVLVTGDYRKYYRHFLAGPYRIFRVHADQPDVAMALLATEVESPGEVVEQFASRQETVANRNLLRAVTQLYYDTEERRLRRGSAVKGAGGARRLADLLMQLDLTWDIYGMEAPGIIGKLPTEFDRFKPAA